MRVDLPEPTNPQPITDLDPIIEAAIDAQPKVKKARVSTTPGTPTTEPAAPAPAAEPPAPPTPPRKFNPAVIAGAAVVALGAVGLILGGRK